MNSNQLINDQYLIKNPNFNDLSKKLTNKHSNSQQVFSDDRFANQFCSCCFLDKQSTNSSTPSCSRDSQSSSPKSTVTQISNNQLFNDQLSDQNSQTTDSESPNLWCSTPSTNELQNTSTNASTESFVLDDKLNTNLVTINSNNSNCLNNLNNINTTPNRITPTFRSFNQVHQQASKQYQTNQLEIEFDNNNQENFEDNLSFDNNLPKSFNHPNHQFFKPSFNHSFRNNFFNYHNHPNQHLLFVNQLIAQKNKLNQQYGDHQETNFNNFHQFKKNNSSNFRLPNTLSLSLNQHHQHHKKLQHQQRKFKSNSKQARSIDKQHFVSRIVAKIKSKKFRLKMYRNSSTSTSLQSQATLNPLHGSFHKPGSNVALAWEDINVYKPIPIVDQLTFRLNTNVLNCDEHNLILRQLNGVIKFGECTAIMGPSGGMYYNYYYY